jgi:RHS repeat-associated protein
VYDVFGAVTARTGSTASIGKFTGEQADDAAGDSGYYYLRARHYDPATGRFVGKDKVEFAQRFAYVGSNPVLYVDPSGLCRRSFNPLDAADCVLDAADTARDAAVAAKRAYVSGYVDLNVTGCVFACVTAGIMISERDGFRPYLGGGVGSPSLTLNVTTAPGQRVTKGWNCGFSTSIGVGPGSVTWQVGVSRQAGHGKERTESWERTFGEAGVSFGPSLPLGGNATCYHVW